jgi:FixJ family two-component response regulator
VSQPIRPAPNQSASASPAKPVVYIVDDDPALREALDSLLRSVGLQVVGYASAVVPAACALAAPACLLLDVRLQGMSGLDVQAELVRSGVDMPVILMTGHGDIPMSVRAMKAGAVDFLTKPFRDQDLLDAVAAAHEGSPPAGPAPGPQRPAGALREPDPARIGSDVAGRQRLAQQADRR